MDLGLFPIPVPVALALVALTGYLVGRRGKGDKSSVVSQARRELRRAHLVAVELEKIALSVRKNLAQHHSRLSKFKERVGQLSGDQEHVAWQDLCQEAEDMLEPTLCLARQIADAYDQIRQQSTHLMTFTELRTDPLTGVSNRRAFDDTLAGQLAILSRYGSQFSLAMFDIDHFKQVNDQFGHLQGDRVLQEVARLLDDAVRETDIVSRFGGEEFAVILPHTGLEGAALLADRMRGAVEQRLPVTVSCGVSTAHDTDTAESLVARADAALYGAKNAGRNCIYLHTGDGIEPVRAPSETPTLLIPQEQVG